MRHIAHAYIDGAFTPVQGTDVIDIINPANEHLIGSAKLGDRADMRRAIAAAKRAQPVFGRTTKQERIDLLKRL